MLGLQAVIGIGSGIAIGYYLANGWRVAGIAMLVAVGVLFPFMMHLADKPIRKWSRERIKHLRGAEGEAFVGWLLQSLENDWHVFYGIQLQDGTDIDQVVVGPSGVYSISTKAWRGLISADEQGLLYNNKRTKVGDHAFMQAIELREKLAAIMGADVPFVNAVLAVPLAFVALRNPHRNVWVLHHDDLVKTIEQGPKRMTKAQISRCVEVLEILQENARRLYKTPVPAGPPSTPFKQH